MFEIYIYCVVIAMFIFVPNSFSGAKSSGGYSVLDAVTLLFAIAASPVTVSIVIIEQVVHLINTYMPDFVEGMKSTMLWESDTEDCQD